MQADRVVARARALLGAPFRLHGRDPRAGLDCVGLVAWACDRVPDAPLDYSLRTGSPARWLARLDQLGMRREGNPQPGDAILVDAGPGQLHCGVWTGNSLIHADAGLRCVVEAPGEPRWPMIGAWALSERT